MPAEVQTAGAAADFHLMERLVPVLVAAGTEILRIRAAGNTVATKADLSPVTEADRVAEAMILAVVRALAPGLPIVAEEEVSAGRIPDVGEAFLLVDALDGTKDFIEGGPDFTLNVGLVRSGKAVAGAVYAPALKRLSLGTAGVGARQIDTATGKERPLRTRPPRPDMLAIVASKSHRTPETDAFIARFPGASLVSAGSSLKLIAIAEATADLYPRLGPTSQWDIAAGDAVLRAAGGSVLDMDGRPLAYGPRVGQRHPFLNPWFVATGGMDPFA